MRRGRGDRVDHCLQRFLVHVHLLRVFQRCTELLERENREVRVDGTGETGLGNSWTYDFNDLGPLFTAGTADLGNNDHERFRVLGRATTSRRAIRARSSRPLLILHHL